MTDGNIIDRGANKTLNGLYSQYGKIHGNDMISRFCRWILLKQIKKLEREIKKEGEK